MKSKQFLTSTRQALAAVPMALALLGGTALLMTGTPAAAQKAAAKKPPTATVTSFVEILVSGTVAGEPGFSEDVAFPKVKVQIGSTLILDEFDPTNRRVALDISMIKAAGVGLQTRKKYIANYTDHFNQVLESPMQPDTAPFLFGLDQKGASADLSGMLSLSLNFDHNGVITGARGTIEAVPVYEEPIDPLFDPAAQ